MVDGALLAFDAALGAQAFFSPCGFPMLPAYVAYYLPASSDARPPIARVLLRGLAGGAIAALGALAVLAAIGLLAAGLGAPFKAHVASLELAGGLAVLALGALTLAGRAPRLAIAARAPRARGALGLASFGALYAAVAAGCVAPLFLGVLVQAATAPTFLEGAARVAAYAGGLAALLVVVTLLVATAQARALAWLRRLAPRLERSSGVVLLLVGAYLVAFWLATARY
jgi:cytochrome c-type biogenesis protein